MFDIGHKIEEQIKQEIYALTNEEITKALKDIEERRNQIIIRAMTNVIWNVRVEQNQHNQTLSITFSKLELEK